MSMIRLDRFLSDALGVSRQQAQKLCRAGRVTVGPAMASGAPLPTRDGGHRLDPTRDEVHVDGRVVAPRGPLTLLMHKPAGVISATHDRDHRTVLDLVPLPLRAPGLAPAGRLDKDTTGLLLLTEDGALNHRLTHPRRHLPKRYEATLASALPSDAAERVAAGLRLGDGTQLKPATLTPLSPASDGSPRVCLTISEGRYHQVKRMVAALGSRVTALHRAAIGGLALPGDLPEGACRPVTELELARLFGAPLNDAASER